ncbi:MAG: carbohydrate kinase family protein [Anaerolineales bacterium]|nr:carbohydrate kinase family protein [Anaerolineales bacterium]
MHNILLTGSIAYDYLMTFPGYFRDHILLEHIESISLSFLVESMVRRRGGTAPNIAYTMSLFGMKSRLLATVGEDFDEYRAWLESKGIDTSGVRAIPGVFTASFFANTDRANSQISSFYPGAMAYASRLSLKELESGEPDLVVISPNDPGAMVKYVQECHELGLAYLFDPSQQLVRMNPAEVCAGIDGALALFVNEYEFALIQKMTGLSLAQILERVQFVVVTRGERGSSVYGSAGEHHIPGVAPDQVADPTGVGDAFRGGFLVAYLRSLDWETCGRVGALTATYCLEQNGTQDFAFTPSEFLARYRRHFPSTAGLEALFE